MERGRARWFITFRKGRSWQNGGKQSTLKPVFSHLKPGFLVFSAVLNSNSHICTLNNFVWGCLKGVGCRVALPWDSGLRGQSWKSYSVRTPLSLTAQCFCPLPNSFRNLCFCMRLPGEHTLHGRTHLAFRYYPGVLQEKLTSFEDRIMKVTFCGGCENMFSNTLIFPEQPTFMQRVSF